MKIIMEPTDSHETEVIIKGNLTTPEVAALLTFINTKSAPAKFTLYKDDEQYFVNTKDIVSFEVADGSVCVKTTTDEYYSKQKLYEIKEALAAEPFAQINKSTIVNIDFVKSVSAEFSGNYTLRLKVSKETMTISRKYMKEFKEKI